MVDVRPQLLGRGLNGPERLPFARGPRHLWNHVPTVPAGNSLIIYKDGTVREGSHFQGWEVDPILTPTLHRYIPGGTRVACEDLDDFSRDSLIAAGYECGQPQDVDVYTLPYTERYALVAGGDGSDPAAAAEAVRLARIAALQAELDALMGTP